MISTTINSHRYSSDDFVEKINSKYQQNGLSGSTLMRGYILRNECAWFLRPYLLAIYDDLNPSNFNGLNSWDAKFRDAEADLNFAHNVNSYLQDILVAELNRYLVVEGYSERAKCQTYRDYLLKCIYFNYAPSLDIRWRDDRGWGVYTKRNIYPFTFIGLYTGNIRLTTIVGLAERMRKQHNKYVWLMSYNNMISVDAEKYGNYTRFINHDEAKSDRISTFSLQIAQGSSFTAIPHRGFIASIGSSRNFGLTFEEGQELVWDYGPRYKI